MPGRRNTALIDYEVALRRHGEVQIGAAARRRRRRNAAIAAVGLAMVGGAVWLFWTLRPEADTLVPVSRFPIMVACTACETRSEIRIQAGATYPYVCPACGERACRELWQCREPDCGELFLPDRSAEAVRCPACGSRSVGSAAAPRQLATPEPRGP